MKEEHDALLQSWAETLRRRPKDAAILDPARDCLRTFAQMEEESHAFVGRFRENFDPGAVVGVQLGNHPAWPAVLMAALRCRIVVLPLERSSADAERTIALQVCQASGLITADVTGDDIAFTTFAAEPIDWEESQPSLMKLTSGTTAAPRAIRFRSEQLLADCTNICETMGITDRDLNFAVIPVSHSYGFSNLITPLIARGVSLVLSADRMPRAVLNDLARSEASVFPGMPVFYQAFCDMGEVPPLPHLRLCISAGAPLPLSVAQKFREKFSRSIHSFYGSSECGGICYDRAAPLLEQGFVGAAMSGVNLEPLESTSGSTQIRVRSHAAGDGYFPHGDSEKLGAGCFVPDDLLTQTEDGYAIVGRVSDLINVAGKKANPAEIEAVLLRYPGVREVVVFGLRSPRRNEEVAACIVAEEDVSEASLLDFCRHRLSGWQVPKRTFFVAEMPVNERGKRSRRALAEQFAHETSLPS